ncbi:sensor histidine kinase [Methylophaga lonarensis]|uniref:sensor histidine kinase n=2 Tax=Methylophaga lonarensis TaxID=999151 RepID=UPI003D292654
MFRHKLYLAFFLLLLITLLQTGLAVWVSGVASYHVERSRIANQMLSEFISLGADKQRLKVWVAQALLVKESPIYQRDNYLRQMNNQLVNLNALILHDQRLAESAEDYAAISQQMKTLSILETNVQALQRSLEEKDAQPLSDPDLWRLLIEIFDNLEGLDLKHVIAEAIDLQRQRSAKAETAAAEALSRVRSLVIGVMIFGSITAILLALLLSRSLYRPLEQLLKGTSALADGDLSYRLPEQGHSEFTMLSRSFNQMAASLQNSLKKEEEHSRQIEQKVTERTRQLQHAIEQLQSAEQQQKRFLADVSHELRTPATAIRGEAEISLRGQDKSPEIYKESLLRIADTANQLSDRIDDLLMLIRGDQEMQLRLRSVTVEQLAQSLSKQAAAALMQHGITLHSFEYIPDEKLHNALLIDLDKIQQAVIIVLDNAARYSPAKTPVALTIQVDSVVEIIIADSGIGISDDDQQHIFDRYFRADGARKLRPDGLGIGLCLCRYIIESHHGQIAVESTLGEGTRVKIELPLMDEHE